MTELAPASGAADLSSWSRHWSQQWWDPQVHLVHNSAGSFGELIPARTVHLTPQSAWVAYGLLGSADPTDHDEADAAIAALLARQYDAPGAVFHGTFARFGESPYPPEEPMMWEDYDPNWRQFVGTTFALMLEDFPERLSDARQAEMFAAVELACEGEVAEGRLGPSYANPALMHAWLDGWCGRRRGDGAQTARAERFAASIVDRFDRTGAFDEFNSPTYYGVDLYALALWRTFPPTRRFADDGARLEAAIWHEAALFHHAGLANFCGPYTRSYGPDATMTVTLIALWIWAAFGRTAAPLPDIDAENIDHGHDLMAGPLIARLARPPEAAADRASFHGFTGDRHIRHELPGRRLVTAALFDDLMIGAESSENDWGGWDQFMPAMAHWREEDGVGVLWLVDPRQVLASVRGTVLDLEVQRPGEPGSLDLRISAESCTVEGAEIRTGGARILIGGGAVDVGVEQLGARLH
ncbi:MAG: hypothetical protein M3Z46_02540, partial [Actinomycetota bacterium]|nr:hypothetical protein [Actinomycetota bacterium]